LTAKKGNGQPEKKIWARARFLRTLGLVTGAGDSSCTSKIDSGESKGLSLLSAIIAARSQEGLFGMLIAISGQE
jgi:hypothetical protein